MLSENLKKLVERATTEVRVHCPWSHEIATKDYRAALGEIEQALEKDPKDVKARLWWIATQLQLDNLPTTALSSPLEEIAELLEDEPTLHLLSFATCISAADKLFAKKHYRLAISLCEKAKKFAELEGTLTKEDNQAVESLYKKLLEEEIERNKEKPRAKQYTLQLEKKLENTEDFPEEYVLEEEPSESTPEPTAETSPNEPKSRSFALWPVVTIAALLIAFGTWSLFDNNNMARDNKEFTQEDKQLLAMQMSIPEEREMVIPVSTNTKSVLDRTLDSVGRRLKELKVVKDESTTTEEDPEIDHQALDPKNAKSLPKSPSQEVESLENIPEAVNDIKENSVPPLDPGKVASVKVEDVGSSPRKAPIPKDALGKGIKLDKDGRVFGPPKRIPSKKGKALDGSVLRPYKVQQFNPPVLYRTISRTEVLSAPSLLASPLAVLKERTPIHVTAKMGRWLELKSTAGNVGYIYSQDAEVVK